MLGKQKNIRKIAFRAAVGAFLVAGALASQAPGSPLRIASHQTFSVEAGDGKQEQTLPWNTTVVRNEDGSIARNARMVMTLTRPDASAIVFEQLTDADGNIRGQIYSSVLTQLGTYTLKAQLANNGPQDSDTFIITRPVDPDADTTFTRNVTLGDSSADTVAINGRISTDLIPQNTQALSLGSPSVYWKDIYVGNVHANNIFAAGSDIAGTTSTQFTINSDNATADTEDMQLIFFRGTTAPNAILAWNSTLNRFEFNQSVAFTSGSIAGSGSGLTGVNADTLDSLDSTYFTNANNINAGTLDDARLSSNVTLMGNLFNGAGQLVQLNGSGFLPGLNASALTDLNATQLTTGTVNDTRLSSNVTLQGNAFNGANQLVRLDASGLLPTLDGSALTNVNAITLNGQTEAYYRNATNINAGTLNDTRLSANVALKNQDNAFSASQTITGQLLLPTQGASGGLVIGGDTNLYRLAADRLRTEDQFQVLATGVANAGLQVYGNTVGGYNIAEFRDSASALNVAVNQAGQVVFGSTSDTNLYRSGANQLRTDDDFHIGSNAWINASTGAINLGGDTNLYRSAANRLQTDDYVVIQRAGVDDALSVVNTSAGGSATFYVRSDGYVQWGPGNAGGDTNLYRATADTLKTDDGFNAGANIVANQGNSAQIRLKSESGVPTVYFGSGDDTNLYRSAADRLKTDDSFDVGGTNLRLTGGGYLEQSGAAAGSTLARSFVGAEAQPRIRVLNTGQLDWGDGTSAVDTNLYRSGADTLKTDDNFFIGASQLAVYQGNASETRVGGQGPAGQAGLRFGSALDTNLYRSAANTLKTDDTFDAASYSVGGTAGASGSACGAGTALTGAAFTSGILTTAGTCTAVGTGTITGVTAGTNLSGGGTSGNVTVNVVNNPTFSGLVTASGGLQGGSTAKVSNALISAVQNGNGFEFGHTNTAGYRGTLGSLSSAGNNFLAFHAEAGTNINTFRTRGEEGSIITSDLNGGFTFGKAANANADNQSLTNLATLSTNGQLALPTQGSTGGLLIGGDTNLYRSGAGQLSSDGEIRSVRAGDGAGLATVNTNLGGWGTWYVSNNGVLNWGSGTGSQDTNLYRDAANVLKTDDDFHAAQNIIANRSATHQVKILDDNARPEITFGNAEDTNLYRSTANELKTDDSMIIAGGLSVEGATVSLSSNVRGINQAIAIGATTVSVTFGTPHSDTSYAVQCTPTYNTTCFVTNKTVNGFTINFGTAAPDANQKVDWLVLR